MIQNINPMTFRGFGIIVAEKDTQIGSAYPLMIFNKNLPIYRTVGPTVLYCDRSPAILYLRHRNDYKSFYLDKMVQLPPETEFYLAALQDNARAVMRCDIPPRQVGLMDSPPGTHIHPKLQATRLYTFFYQEKEQGFIFPGESHSMPEITYVDQGCLHSVADGQDLLLKQGDMVLYTPGQWHMQYADIGVAPRYITISFEAEGLDYQALGNKLLKTPQKAIELLQAMLREQEEQEHHAEDMILALLTQLLVLMLRCDETEVPLRSTQSMNHENAIIRKAQQYISDNVRKRLSVPLVAQNADISPSYLTTLFQKHLQISPGEYIRRIKLQESKQMIREGDLNFTQIAQTLHYSTIHHFSRQFKEKFGVTPSEYAKSIK